MRVHLDVPEVRLEIFYPIPMHFFNIFILQKRFEIIESNTNFRLFKKNLMNQFVSIRIIFYFILLKALLKIDF